VPETTIGAKALDHLALWVEDRDVLAGFACEHLGFHEIERTDSFTLVGADARRGKLTLFEADGLREPGVLERVVLRVGDLERALGRLPAELHLDRQSAGLVLFEGPERLGLGLVEAPGCELDYDIDHIVLRVSDPASTGVAFQKLGFERDGERLAVADKHVLLAHGAGPSLSSAPLLNHVALLVDSGEGALDWARRTGVEVAEVRDAENTFAVFVCGPDRIKIEYVEHKPNFSLV
jgi:catechol 2,3-dioxygenase-like lactoylglutathione lyase family enzyme